MNLNDRVSALTKENVSAKALEQTYKYQKIYGFKMGTGQEGTHNNEADAFKHAFMQAYASICINSTYLLQRLRMTRTFVILNVC